MIVRFKNKGSILIVTMEGDVDHHMAEYAASKIDREMVKHSNRDLIFDFSKTEFMDSSGIGIVLGRYKNVRENEGVTVVASVSANILRIFDMSGIRKFIPFYKNVDEAIAKILEVRKNGIHK